LQISSAVFSSSAVWEWTLSSCWVDFQPSMPFTLSSGSATQASDYRIIKNLHITHVVNATANCPDAFPNTLSYLSLRLTDDAQQDLVEALPLASRFIDAALKADPAGRVLVHCSMGRSRSSALTLAFLMEHRRWSLLHALRWLKERRACSAPNLNFLSQLMTYEELLFGKTLLVNTVEVLSSRGVDLHSFLQEELNSPNELWNLKIT
uniref:protein-tyrosine-phosphatase n=1 Tax=Salarias fasciatus TaxID=181472 RepID=A0A672JI78_SALFA